MSFFRLPLRFSPIKIVAFFGFIRGIPNELTGCTIPSASRLGAIHLSCLKATKIASGFESPPGWWCHSCGWKSELPVFPFGKKRGNGREVTHQVDSPSHNCRSFVHLKLSYYQQDTVSCVEDEIWVKTVLVVSKLGEHPPQMETKIGALHHCYWICPLEMRFLLAHFQQSHKGMHPEAVGNCNPRNGNQLL